MAYGVKTGGRIKGSTTHEIQKIRETFQNILSDNLEQINNDLREISDPAQRIKLLMDLARFVIPTLKATEITAVEKAEIRPIIVSLGRGIDPNAIEHYPTEYDN